ncbi:MAG TPA: hypothetical protein VK601_02865, partial [Kofleriaceae bacterium]|nr:hypothetical protein [Kofleriaceae bacterium]
MRSGSRIGYAATRPPGVAAHQGVAGPAVEPGLARLVLLFMFMEYLKKIIVVASLISMVGACYIEPRGPRYAHRGCAYGWY